MTKPIRTSKYRIVMEQIKDPGKDILDVQVISFDIYAKDVEEASEKAWNTVNVDKKNYEIILIEAMHRPYYRYNFREDNQF